MYFSFTVKESSGDGFEIEARDNVDSFSLQKKKKTQYFTSSATCMSHETKHWLAYKLYISLETIPVIVKVK